jgi:hypothetical protein
MSYHCPHLHSRSQYRLQHWEYQLRTPTSVSTTPSRVLLYPLLPAQMPGTERHEQVRHRVCCSMMTTRTDVAELVLVFVPDVVAVAAEPSYDQTANLVRVLLRSW